MICNVFKLTLSRGDF